MGKKSKNDNKQNKSDSNYSGDDDSESIKSDVDENKTVNVPTDYLFPSFFIFVIHGPFVPTNQRLDILLLDNKDKKKGE